MKKFHVNEEGFTLVELMVVVAIIGILSAVAIPNFKKYQAKSKQSEAKLILASVYTAETTTMGDSDTYASCLNDIGADTPQTKGYYSYGFKAKYDAGITVLTGKSLACADDHFFIPGGTALKGSQDTTAPTDASSAGVIAPTTFTAEAIGNVVNVKDKFDKWTIDQTKALVNSTPGI